MSIEMAKQLQKNIQTKTNARRRNEGRKVSKSFHRGEHSTDFYSNVFPMLFMKWMETGDKQTRNHKTSRLFTLHSARHLGSHLFHRSFVVTLCVCHSTCQWCGHWKTRKNIHILKLLYNSNNQFGCQKNGKTNVNSHQNSDSEWKCV